MHRAHIHPHQCIELMFILTNASQHYAHAVISKCRTFITDDGSVRIKADGVSLIMGILLDANEQGHPILHSTSCHFKVGDISVKFKGGARYMRYNYCVFNHNVYVLQHDNGSQGFIPDFCLGGEILGESLFPAIR